LSSRVIDSEHSSETWEKHALLLMRNNPEDLTPKLHHCDNLKISKI